MHKLKKHKLILLCLSAVFICLMAIHINVGAVTNNNLKKINSEVGNTKFQIFSSNDKNIAVKIHGKGIKAHFTNVTGNQESLLGSRVLHLEFDRQLSNESYLQVTYHSGARFGNTPLDTTIKLNNFTRYPNNKGLGNLNNRRYINISENLSRGLFYYGFNKIHAHYEFYNNNQPFNIGGQDAPAYMTFNSLNGIEPATYNNAIDKHVGEWVRYVNSSQSATGFVSKDSALGNLNLYNLLHIPGIKGIGGKPNTPFDDYLGGKSFLTHSVTFPAFSNNSQAFEFGASYGSAWYVLSTNSIKNPKRDKTNEDPTPDEPNGEKSVSKTKLTKQGEEYFYTIKGNLPEKHRTYKYVPYTVSVPYTKYVGTGKNRHQETYYEDETRYDKQETNLNDSYSINDIIPKDVSVKSVQASGINKSAQNGNNISFNANNDYMLKHSNGAYSIKINVKADHLPKVTKEGWYYIKNKAHVNGTSYGNTFNHETNEVYTRIKKIKANIFHYDYDNDEDGDFGFIDHHDDAIKYNFDWNDNFNDKQGIIKKDTLYGYNGDEKKVNILSNAYKNNNPEWRYRYVWGDNNQEKITLNDEEEDNGKDYEFARNYYFPYIVPRAKLHNEMIKIDTDKSKNGLPFQLIMSGESFLYREFSDYNNSMVNINVFDKYNHAILYNKIVPLNSLLNNNQDDTKYTKFTGRLNTDGLNIPKGQKVDVDVQTSVTNPNAIQEDYPADDNTFGFIASENALLGNNKGNNNNDNHDTKNDNNNSSKKHYKQMSYTTVDPVTYYVGSGQYRHQETKYVQHNHYYEVLVNDDEPVHYKQMSYKTVDPYTYTTGFGQYKHQVTINVTHNHYYEVPVNAPTNNSDNNAVLNDNTFNNQANKTYFKNNQNSYTAPERTIKYDGVNQVRVLDEQLRLDQNRYASAKTGFGMKNDLKLTYRGNLNAKQYMNDGTAMNYVFPKSFIKDSNIHYDQDHHDHKLDKENMYTDRLKQVNNYQDSNDSFNDLDNLNSFNDDENNKVNEINKSIPINLQDEHFGTFTTQYVFYPRIAEYDNGNVDLAPNIKEPQSHDDKGINTGNDTAANFFGSQGTQDQAIKNQQYRDGGNRFYTPFWLKLGKYNTSFDKVDYSNTDKSRLGANWLNIDELRPVNMYAHAYLSSNSPNGRNELQDQLAFQPILSEKQHVIGFTKSENDWINHPFNN
ncbi:hypothetical protein [Apilactobacillus micheneri]|uniref:hypothetical protein n=1 Tax=Apilactobacillus micheneri TaxID=1899430 RepID=UPI00112BC6AB|nr:hypothetical protein [Apilactobacillus micheneri]TPR43341.1 hypothetical protein DY128_07380 [Apilactobacillus micheneri]